VPRAAAFTAPPAASEGAPERASEGEGAKGGLTAGSPPTTQRRAPPEGLWLYSPPLEAKGWEPAEWATEAWRQFALGHTHGLVACLRRAQELFARTRKDGRKKRPTGGEKEKDNELELWPSTLLSGLAKLGPMAKWAAPEGSSSAQHPRLARELGQRARQWAECLGLPELAYSDYSVALSLAAGSGLAWERALLAWEPHKNSFVVIKDLAIAVERAAQELEVAAPGQIEALTLHLERCLQLQTYILWELKRFPDAVESATRALALPSNPHNPKRSCVLRLRAQSLVELGRFTEAREDLEVFSRLHPEHLSVRLRLGTVQSVCAAHEAAVKTFKELQELLPKLVQLKLAFANAYLRYAGGGAGAGAVTHADGGLPKPALQSFQVVDRALALEQAEQLTRTLLAEEPTHGGALLLLARVLEASGKLEAARQTYFTVVAQTKALPASYLRLADLQLRTARGLFRELTVLADTLNSRRAAHLGAARLRDQNSTIPTDLTDDFADPNQPADAFEPEAGEKEAKAWPPDVLKAEEQLQLKLQAVRLDILHAHAAAKAALSLEPDNPDALFVSGATAVFLLGNRAPTPALKYALTALSKCLSLRPEHAPAAALRGLLHLRHDKPVEALRDLTVAVKADPSRRIPRFALAALLALPAGPRLAEAHTLLDDLTKGALELYHKVRNEARELFLAGKGALPPLSNLAHTEAVAVGSESSPGSLSSLTEELLASRPLDPVDLKRVELEAAARDAASALANRGLTAMLRGQLVGARADLDLAVSLWPQGPLPLLFRAVVKQKLGLLEAASSDFRAAVPLLQADFRTVDAERRRLEHAPSRAPAELVALAAVARNQPDGPSMPPGNFPGSGEGVDSKAARTVPGHTQQSRTLLPPNQPLALPPASEPAATGVGSQGSWPGSGDGGRAGDTNAGTSGKLMSPPQSLDLSEGMGEDMGQLAEARAKPFSRAGAAVAANDDDGGGGGGVDPPVGAHSRLTHSNRGGVFAEASPAQYHSPKLTPLARIPGTGGDDKKYKTSVDKGSASAGGPEKGSESVMAQLLPRLFRPWELTALAGEAVLSFLTLPHTSSSPSSSRTLLSGHDPFHPCRCYAVFRKRCWGCRWRGRTTSCWGWPRPLPASSWRPTASRATTCATCSTSLGCFRIRQVIACWSERP
jgi:tetratricopeptide (TPR) repeat protein